MKKKIFALGICIACPFFSEANNQPTITHLEWGKVQVKHPDGTEILYDSQTAKDCKIFPDGSIGWDWNLTGTRHRPGIQIADVKDIVDKVDVLILTRGVLGVLQIKAETLEYLDSLGKKYHCALTNDAVKLYEELVEKGEKVGIILHSTC